jgi:hypothetical protein
MHRINGHNRLTVKSYNWHPSMGLPNSKKLGFTLFNHVLGLSFPLLYYARAVDATMLPAINEISDSQASPTQKTKNACTMLLDYAATYPLVIIRYYASNMALNVDTDAAYLVLPNALSRYAGHYILSDTPPPPPEIPNPKPNGAILTVCKTVRNVMTSAAEAETAGVFKTDR